MTSEIPVFAHSGSRATRPVKSREGGDAEADRVQGFGGLDGLAAGGCRHEGFDCSEGPCPDPMPGRSPRDSSGVPG